MARERLRRISPNRLDDAERTEYLVGLGEELYLEGSAGAAASIFGTVFESNGALSAPARERVLDWWASALDHEARPRADIERQPLYQDIRDRMRDELARNPASTVASYWLAAAASGQGDHQAAWDAALAGWVRAPLADDHGTSRCATNSTRLVQRMIVPQRAPRDRAAARLRAVEVSAGEHGMGSVRRFKATNQLAQTRNRMRTRRERPKRPRASRLSSSRQSRHRPSAAPSATPRSACARGRSRRSPRPRASGTSNNSSSCTVRIMRAPGQCAERGVDVSIIARFRMSAAVP